MLNVGCANRMRKESSPVSPSAAVTHVTMFATSTTDRSATNSMLYKWRGYFLDSATSDTTASTEPTEYITQYHDFFTNLQISSPEFYQKYLWTTDMPVTVRELELDEEAPSEEHSSLLVDILKDLHRLHPVGKEFFFQQGHLMLMLRRVLYCWSWIHSSISYRQGMHDLLAVLLYAALSSTPISLPVPAGDSDQAPDLVVGCIQEIQEDGSVVFEGSDEDAPSIRVDFKMFIQDLLKDDRFFPNLEEHLYELFAMLMEWMGPLYSTANDPSNRRNILTDARHGSGRGGDSGEKPLPCHASPSVVQEFCGYLQNDLLRKYDPDLADWLRVQQIEPTVFGLRWVRLLLAREFPLDEVVMIWDTMFCHMHGKLINHSLTSSTMHAERRYGPPLLRYLCIAILTTLSSELKASDNTQCHQLLMHLPILNSVDLVTLALHLEHPQSQESNHELRVVEFQEGDLGMTVTSVSIQGQQRLAVRVLTANGQADASGRIELWDMIHSINGLPVFHLSTEHIKSHIQKIGRPFFISFEHPLHASSSSSSSNPSSPMMSLKPNSQVEYEPDYLPGERCYANVEAALQHLHTTPEGDHLIQHLVGRMLVTNYRLIYHNLQGRGISWQIPIMTISEIIGMDNVSFESTRSSSSSKMYVLLLRCKNIQVQKFSFTNHTEYGLILKCLKSVVFPKDLTAAFCFDYQPTLQLTTALSTKASHPILLQEYQRLGLLDGQVFKCVEQAYRVCDTYPNYIILPLSFQEDKIYRVAGFRSKRRIPVITWVHAGNGATICRSSQPLVGIKSARCFEDEELVRQLCTNSYKARSQRYSIMDARGQLSAVGNKAMGKGTENCNNYRGAHLTFMNIENIHSLRSSFQAMMNLFDTSNGVLLEESSSFYARVESTSWLKHVHMVLKASTEIARLVHRGESCLAHCSDGWDRTAQMVSLAQLMLDPYYRTIRGLEVLIEKDWCGFGHQFRLRCGHLQSENNANREEWSPIFVLWLDCIHQILRQFPTHFEYNERLLIFLADHVYSCKYGNFLYDSEKARRENDARPSACIWNEIQLRVDKFQNPNYLNYDQANTLSMASTLTKNLRLWEGYFCRWDTTMLPPVLSFPLY